MKRNLDENTSWMVAAAFAEAGEWNTARELIPRGKRPAKVGWLDRIFAAITFAEADVPKAAQEMLTDTRSINLGSRADVLHNLGLSGVHLCFGTVMIND